MRARGLAADFRIPAGCFVQSVGSPCGLILCSQPGIGAFEKPLSNRDLAGWLVILLNWSLRGVHHFLRKRQSAARKWWACAFQA